MYDIRLSTSTSRRRGRSPRRIFDAPPTSTSTPTSTEDLQQQKLLLLPDHDTDIHSTIEPPPIVTTFPVDPTGTYKHKGESFVNGEFYCREYHVTL